jgi:adenine phosphoribosyltransferase
MDSSALDLKQHIRGIPDFPKPGILFYDISTLLRNADAWQVAMGRLARAVAPAQPDLLASNHAASCSRHRWPASWAAAS